MATEHNRIKRLLAALQELVLMESTLVQGNALDELPALQERIEAVQGRLIAEAGEGLTYREFIPVMKVREESRAILMSRSQKLRADIGDLRRGLVCLKTQVPAYVGARVQPPHSGLNAAA